MAAIKKWEGPVRALENRKSGEGPGRDSNRGLLFVSFLKGAPTPSPPHPTPTARSRLACQSPDDPPTTTKLIFFQKPPPRPKASPANRQSPIGEQPLSNRLESPPPPGLVDVQLIGGKAGRTKETNFGSYLASLLASTARGLPNFEKAKGPVNVGFLNAGAIRADIEVRRPFFSVFFSPAAAPGRGLAGRPGGVEGGRGRGARRAPPRRAAARGERNA